jgi:hypothetical protein
MQDMNEEEALYAPQITQKSHAQISLPESSR